VNVDESRGFRRGDNLAKQGLAADRFQLAFLLKFQPKIVKQFDGVNPGFELAVLPAKNRRFRPGDVEKLERLGRISQNDAAFRQDGGLTLRMGGNGICAREDWDDQRQADE
jgi:hypothetical protein